jgi:4-amino-4-deoxy-L-arabinose transferase-like glycosyltransferase
VKKYKIEFCFGLVAFLTFIVALTVGLSDDETYYWSWSLRPALSYFDHPPLLAWTLWLSTHIFGKTNFAVRLPALLSLWSCSFLFIRWLKRFSLPWKYALCIVISAPLFFVFSWITLPDVLFLPLALLTVDFVSNKRFAWAGLALGLSILAKWHSFLLIPGLITLTYFLDLTPKQKLKGIFYFLGIAALLQAPVIFWNFQYDFISFRYHLVERHGGQWGSIGALVGKGFGFIAGLLVFNGAAFIYLLLQYAKTIWQKSRTKTLSFDSDDLVLLAFALPFVLIFGLSALKGETRIYWPGFALFPLTILFLKNLRAQLNLSLDKKVEKVALRSCFFLMGVLVISLYLPIGAYVKPIVEKFQRYDLRLSPVGDLSGWQPWVEAELAQAQTPPDQILFLAADFRLASQVLWNSHLNFEQVSSLQGVHEYAVWPRPNLSHFSKVIIFGDNRRKISREQFDSFCLPNNNPKTVFEFFYLSQLVKRIESLDCSPKTI